MTLDTPDILDDEKSDYYQREAVGAYDLIIFDRCRPKVMPQANTFFLGAMPVQAIELPPEKEGGEPRQVDIWQTEERVDGPKIIDIDSSHPLTQWMAMGNVLIAEAAPIKVPSGGTVLIDSHKGPMMAIAPRDGFEDLVLAFPFTDEITDDKGIKRLRAVTNWQGRSSYPVFMLNLLQYFGGGQAGLDTLSAQPGGQVALLGPEPDKELDIHKPSGDRAEVPVDRLGRGKFTDTEELGIYDVQYGGKPIDHFSVNLFDSAESDISVRKEIELGHIAVKGRTSNWEAARTEFWKYILLAGFVLLLVEWWVYHRRVYV